MKSIIKLYFIRPKVKKKTVYIRPSTIPTTRSTDMVVVNKFGKTETQKKLKLCCKTISSSFKSLIGPKRTPGAHKSESVERGQIIHQTDIKNKINFIWLWVSNSNRTSADTRKTEENYNNLSKTSLGCLSKFGKHVLLLSH